MLQPKLNRTALHWFGPWTLLRDILFPLDIVLLQVTWKNRRRTLVSTEIQVLVIYQTWKNGLCISNDKHFLWTRDSSLETCHLYCLEMHKSQWGWNDGSERGSVVFGSTLFIFSAFNLFILRKKCLPMEHGTFAQCCFNPLLPALCTYLPSLQKLLSLLMRLIKPVQSLFNEALVAWSTEGTIGRYTLHIPNKKGPKTLQGILVKSLRKMVLIYLATGQEDTFWGWWASPASYWQVTKLT